MSREDEPASCGVSGVPVSASLRPMRRGWGSELIECKQVHSLASFYVDKNRMKWHEDLSGINFWNALDGFVYENFILDLLY
jgi:hypothetical protein